MYIVFFSHFFKFFTSPKMNIFIIKNTYKLLY